MRLLLLLLCLPATARASAQGFPALAESVLSSAPLRGAEVGALFVSLSDGTTYFSHNPDLPLIPASTAKLATSAAALDLLKPGFRFSTTLLADREEPGQKKLEVLVWRGAGDPSLSGRNRSSRTEIFETWASSLTALGISRVGRLVLDNRYFEGPVTVPSWPEDELSYWYEAETSAISFNDNCVDLEFIPAARPGRRPKIILSPDFGYLKVKNRAVTGPRGGVYTLDKGYRREPGTNKVLFFGSIPAHGPARTDSVSVHEPAWFAAHTLRSVWKKKGIKVGKIVPWEQARLDEERLSPLLTWKSEPLERLIKVIDTNSQNLYAEQVLKTMGKESSGHGSFEQGLAVVSRFLVKAGLSETDFHLVDGSGLSEDNRLTSAGLIKLLRHMSADPAFPAYYESLAAPGVDRSARNRMKGDPLAGGMRLKHGTVGHARNLAGYLHSRSGRLYAFALLVNAADLDRPAVDAALDELCLGAAHLLP